jgi:hypothetical protein
MQQRLPPVRDEIQPFAALSNKEKQDRDVAGGRRMVRSRVAS